MKTRHLLCIIGVLLCLQCMNGCETRSVAPTQVPRHFMARIGGHIAPSYKVECSDEKTLTYYANLPSYAPGDAGTKKTSINISADQWKRLRQNLDEADVWHWRSEYINKGIYDGTIWELNIEYADRKKSTFGSNAYPNQRSFEKFLSAVGELTGGLTFQ